MENNEWKFLTPKQRARFLKELQEIDHVKYIENEDLLKLARQKHEKELHEIDTYFYEDFTILGKKIITNKEVNDYHLFLIRAIPGFNHLFLLNSFGKKKIDTLRGDEIVAIELLNEKSRIFVLSRHDSNYDLEVANLTHRKRMYLMSFGIWEKDYRILSEMKLTGDHYNQILYIKADKEPDEEGWKIRKI